MTTHLLTFDHQFTELISKMRLSIIPSINLIGLAEMLVHKKFYTIEKTIQANFVNVIQILGNRANKAVFASTRNSAFGQ